MLSPAHLLLIERLIEILMALVRAIDLATEGEPTVQQASTRFLLSRLAIRLTRLRERNLAPDLAPDLARGPAAPLRAAPPLPVRPRRSHEPLAFGRITPGAYVTVPPRRPSLSKLRLASS